MLAFAILPTMKRVFSQTFGVVGAIIEKEGKILLVRECSKQKIPDAGKWNQPAGWIDVGEDPTKAVKREVLEETGYSFEPTGILGIYSLIREDLTKDLGATPHALKIIFTGEITRFNSAQRNTDEIDEIQWFTPEEIYAMDIESLRDLDIKNEVSDYFANTKYPLTLLHHFIQSS